MTQPWLRRELAQILATLDVFGLQAGGSSSSTSALGRADRPDKGLTWGLQHLGLSGSRLPSGGDDQGMARPLRRPDEPLSALDAALKGSAWTWEAVCGVSRGACSQDS